ncbi:MAG: hypothetical protein ACQEQ4_11075, partial [Fibrobacterota bacterium]
IPEELSYGDGFSFNGTNDILDNIAIYNNTHFENGNFDLAKLNSDFDGENPDAIIYINGGAPWSEEGQDNGFYELLLKAAEAGIGILTIGDASVSDAESIDPAKTTFPVMGVQNWYWFKAFNGITVREFNFLEETDGTDWETPDEIHFRMDDIGGEDLYRIALGEWTVAPPEEEDIIYEATVGASPDYIIDERKNDITYDEGDDVEVRHANGEWAVYAKAVDVIEQDYYAPEMNAGVFINHDIILGYEPNDKEIYIVDEVIWNNQWTDNADWGSELWIDGEVEASYNDPLPGLENSGDLANYGEVETFTDDNGKDREAFRFTQDYALVNPNTGREILVIEKGRRIADFSRGGDGDDLVWYNLADPTEPCNYFGSYSSGGYRDLQIKLFPAGERAQIFDNVFPNLGGIDELDFRHWEHDDDKTGRLRAAADIWAFNEQLDLRSFEELFDPNAVFDPDAYYVNYLGDQVAGREGIPNFVQPPETQPEFGDPYNAKLDDLLGYDEDGKLYHTISVVQTGRRRLGMLGFQPTYLADVEKTLILLEDITKWIAVDDWRYPDPHINLVYDGTTQPADGRLAYRDADEIEVEVDFTVKGPDIRRSSYNVILDITYNGTDYQLRKDGIDRDPGDKVDYHYFNLRDAFTVDPADNNARDIEITATIEPTSMRFLEGKAGGSLKLRKLEAPSFDADDTSFEEEMEVRISEEGDVDGDAVSDDVFIQVTDPTNEDGASVFRYMLKQSGTVRAYAFSERYLNSELNESESFTREATLPPPQADSASGTVLFADDTITLFVDLSNLESEPDYEIEYTVTYDGADVISTRGERNESVEILLADFVDRENRTATDFAVTAKTIGIDDIWNDSREVDFNYTVRKLETDPAVSQNVESLDGFNLRIAAVYDGTEYDGDIHGEPAYILLGEDEAATTENASAAEFNFTSDTTFVFWAEHTRYIHSDIVFDNEYQRITRGVDEGSAYFDAAADGIIDSAVVELEARWEKLMLPDRIVCTFPGTDNTVTVENDIRWEEPGNIDNARMVFPVPGFEDIKTSFPVDRYISLEGQQYDIAVPVGDSIAPVIYKARYNSGEFFVDGERSEDTVVVTFSEEISSLYDGAPQEENLFLLGETDDRYSGEFTYESNPKDSTYTFAVNLDRFYPTQGDSIWINVEAITDVVDEDGNIQDNPQNRKVELSIEKLRINVKMDAFWIDENDTFDGVDAYSDFGRTLDDEEFDVPLGGLIVLDPMVPFHEDQVRTNDFDARIVILDEVGNVVVSVEGREFAQDNIQVIPLERRLPKTDGEDDSDYRWVLAVAWDGTNSNGREVHARSYKILAVTQWPGIDAVIPVNGLIPVQKEY